MPSKGFDNCIKIHSKIPRGKITEKKLIKIIKTEIGLDRRTVQKYLHVLIEFGFIKKIDFDVYEKVKRGFDGFPNRSNK